MTGPVTTGRSAAACDEPLVSIDGRRAPADAPPTRTTPTLEADM
jgi:hypothetical protein